MENVIILTMVYSTSIQALQYSELYDKFSFHFLVLLLVFVTTGSGAATSEEKLKNFLLLKYSTNIESDIQLEEHKIYLSATLDHPHQ